MFRKIMVAFLLAWSSHASTYYVQTTGNDTTGNGTSAQPWKTLAKACAVVLPGNTIQIGSGEFKEANPISVAAGVSIAGSGRSATRLFLPVNDWAPFKPEFFFIKLISPIWDSLPTSISDFTIDGTGSPTFLSGGIVVQKRSNITFRNIDFDHIAWCGLWLEECKKTLVDGCNFFESSLESTVYCSGALQLGHVDSIEIKNFTIRAYEQGTGYGIVAMGFGEPRASWKNVLIHHSVIDLKGTAAWQNGTAANIAIEANITWPIEACEIHHCTINNQISLPGGANMIRTGKPTMRIHHNTFSILMTPGAASGYTVELSLDDTEVDNNYVESGAFFIAGFYEPRSNVRIHHNVVCNSVSLWEWSIICGQATDLWINNNTFYWSSGAPDWSIVGLAGDIHGLVFQNNIVEVTDSIALKENRVIKFIDNATWDGTQYSVTNLCVRNNIYKNASLDPTSWPGTYSANTQASAQITATGSFPTPFYMPDGASSNLVNAGSTEGIPGIVFSGSAPDIGALEYGQTTPIYLSPRKSTVSKHLPLMRPILTFDIQGRIITNSRMAARNGIRIISGSDGTTLSPFQNAK